MNPNALKWLAAFVISSSLLAGILMSQKKS